MGDFASTWRNVFADTIPTHIPATTAQIPQDNYLVEEQYLCPETGKVAVLSAMLPPLRDLIVVNAWVAGSCGHTHKFRTNYGQVTWSVMP